VDGDADAAVEASWWGEWWGAGMAICLERGADLHMAQLMPLPLAVSCFSKIQIGLPFWYRLTRVVSDKGPLNGCVCVWCCYSTGSQRPHCCRPLISAAGSVQYFPYLTVTERIPLHFCFQCRTGLGVPKC